MLHRARHLVAAQLKNPQPFPRLAIAAGEDASPRLRELGQPPAGLASGERPAGSGLMPPTVRAEIELPERWDGLA